VVIVLEAEVVTVINFLLITATTLDMKTTWILMDVLLLGAKSTSFLAYFFEKFLALTVD
jgi:hypothetical protein